MKTPATLKPSPYMPVDEDVQMYNTAYGHLTPWVFSDWKTESLSWKDGAYLHAGLNPNFRSRLTGPDALKLLRESCVNSLENFSIGCTRHGVMCNENGNVMTDGLIWRLGEREFVAMGNGPYINYLADSGRYDVELVDEDKSKFLFQIAGPNSLAIVEALTGESFRDLDFFWHRESSVKRSGLFRSDICVRIFRVGVARTLAYEVHGDIEHAHAVYEAIMQAGAPLDLQRLGMQAYGLNHTEGGFAQTYIHFLPAWSEDKAFMDYIGHDFDGIFEDLKGSAGQDPVKRYANPFELQLGGIVRFDHDFTGREALERIALSPARQMVTLEWNQDDVLGIFAAQFAPRSTVQSMDLVANQVWQGFMAKTFCDDVFVDGVLHGISSGRMFSHHYGKMLSLGIMDTPHARIGREVEVLWGDPGTTQRIVRATVSRFPYIDLPFNQDVDVSKLP